MQIIFDPILAEMRSADEAVDLGGSFQGAYAAVTAYTLGQTVAYNGLVYVCIQDGSGQQPDTQTAYWGKITSKGEIGPQGVQGEQGAQGIQGIQGIQGVQGDAGATGSQGMQGIQGEPGTSAATSFGVDGLFFDDDTDTGLLRSGADSLALKTAGAAAITIDATQNATFGANLTVSGNLLVNGDTITHNVATVEIEDNLLILNNGEAGAGVTAGAAGIEIDRGSATNYQFMFRELDDAFVVGEIGALQAVATRQDSPIDTGLVFWNGTAQRFDTDAGLLFDGSDLMVPGKLNGLVMLENANGSMVIGIGAGAALSGDADNLIAGVGAAAAATSMSNSVVLGKGALGTGVCTGSNNFVAGLNTAKDATTGTDFVAIGQNALLYGPSDAIAIGYNAGTSLTVSSICIGRGAGDFQTTLGASVSIGRFTGRRIFQGVAIGDGALGSTGAGGQSNYNVGIGYDAGKALTTIAASKNVVMGHSAAKVATLMSDSVVIGADALLSGICVSSGNVVVGVGAALNLTTGSGVFIGLHSGADLTTETAQLRIAMSSGVGLINGDFSSGNVGLSTIDYGGGVGVLAIADATTAPASTPTGGGIIYVESGALKYKGTSGTVTTLGVA